jgi:hypothetical protein
LGKGKRLKTASPPRVEGKAKVGAPVKGSRKTPAAPVENAPRSATVGTAKLDSFDAFRTCRSPDAKKKTRFRTTGPPRTKPPCPSVKESRPPPSSRTVMGVEPPTGSKLNVEGLN